jgi:iron(III) transport system permease protein
LLVAIPLVYLAWDALSLPWSDLREMLLRPRVGWTIFNTLLLCVTVLICTIALSLPVAWLLTRTDLPGRGWLLPVLVMPLAVPGYLTAFALLSIGGDYGASARVLGVPIPRLSGLLGSTIALSFYNFPYMLLTLRAGFRAMDPSLEAAARTLGRSPIGAFFSAGLPQLRPALLAGGLLILLHVVGDFGVVSLMRYETFSVVLYGSRLYEPNYAAWIALMMVGMSSTFIAMELWLMRGKRFERAGLGPGLARRRVRLGRWTWLAMAGVLLLVVLAVGVPVGAAGYWALQPKLDYITQDFAGAAAASMKVSLPTALIATLIAMPVAFLSARYRGKRAQLLERVSYVGYATPGLALGLAFLGFALWLDGWVAEPGETLLYQSLGLMVLAYVLHFMAEAVGPIRASLLLAGRRFEEASRTLGRGPFATFVRVTLPLIRGGILASISLVFLSCMKELPLALMLRPMDFDTLAFNLWDLTNEALYAEASPYALGILGVSFAFVITVLLTDRRLRS